MTKPVFSPNATQNRASKRMALLLRSTCPSVKQYPITAFRGPVYTCRGATERSVSEGVQHRYSGTFFTKAKHFVVEGGNFQSVTNIHQVVPSAPPEFPVIPFGYINLLHKIEPRGGSGVVHHNYGRNSVRTVYSAGIHGCKSNMTVALYQGKGAEDRWRKDISQYSELRLHHRHPYLAQLYGIVNTANLHAVAFHDSQNFPLVT
ncbi:hypothetical protein B0H14DRAFT_2567965 [Mycena olivaceomarginata]|nr:hypothetical protein B0H14DRAFT_2567965 [Mycena olivaceomarginata]